VGHITGVIFGMFHLFVFCGNSFKGWVISHWSLVEYGETPEVLQELCVAILRQCEFVGVVIRFADLPQGLRLQPGTAKQPG